MTKRTAEAQRTPAENGTGPTVAHLAALDEVFREEAAAHSLPLGSSSIICDRAE